jgi:hypothetical protein
VPGSSSADADPAEADANELDADELDTENADVVRRRVVGMNKQLMIGIGALLVLMGGLWAGQGLGLIGGSPMTDETLWAIIGPIVSLAGVVLVALGARRAKD